MKSLVERLTDAARQFPSLEPRARLDEDDIVEAERVLGRRLPDLLRTLYLDVGNGGFGLAIRALLDPEGDPAESSVGVWQRSQSIGRDRAPRGLLALFPLGCGMESYVDLDDRSLRVVRFDPNAEEVVTRLAYDSLRVSAEQRAFYQWEAPSLQQWLELRLDHRDVGALESMRPQLSRWPDLRQRLPELVALPESEGNLRFERRHAAAPERRAVNPFTKVVMTHPARPMRIERVQLERNGAVVRSAYGVIMEESVGDAETLTDSFDSEEAARIFMAAAAKGFRDDGYELVSAD